jgi:hypothetical protein
MPDEVKLLPCLSFPELQDWFFQKLDPQQRDGFFRAVWHGLWQHREL